jgi:hypothetical protein
MPIIRDLPPFFDFVYTNKDGSLTPNAKLYNDLTSQVLSQNFNVGIQLPIKTTAQIAAYASDANIPVGTLWFNSTLSKLQFKTGAGTLETVTST